MHDPPPALSSSAYTALYLSGIIFFPVQIQTVLRHRHQDGLLKILSVQPAVMNGYLRCRPAGFLSCHCIIDVRKTITAGEFISSYLKNTIIPYRLYGNCLQMRSEARCNPKTWIPYLLLGTANFSLSCLKILFSVFIMPLQSLLFLFFNVCFQCFVIHVFRTEHQTLRHQDFGFYPRPQKLLRCHSVVFDKSQCRKRGSTQHTHPAYRFHPTWGRSRKYNKATTPQATSEKKNCLSDSPKNMDSV